MNISKIALLNLTLTLAACGTAPTFQSVPPQAGTAYSIGSAPAIAETTNTQDHLDSDKSIVYFQQFGGGGVGLGLLLGPFGAAANATMIGNATKADTAKMLNRIPVKPRSLFDAAARKNGLDIGGQSAAAAITPYLYVVKVEGERLLVASAMIVEQKYGATPWTGKYMYQLPESYTIAEFAGLDAVKSAQLQQDAAQGFDQLVRRMQQETHATVTGEKPITVRSDLLMPRFSYDMPGTVIEDAGDITWLRTWGGVFGLRKTGLTVAPR